MDGLAVSRSLERGRLRAANMMLDLLRDGLHLRTHTPSAVPPSPPSPSLPLPRPVVPAAVAANADGAEDAHREELMLRIDMRRPVRCSRRTGRCVCIRALGGATRTRPHRLSPASGKHILGRSRAQSHLQERCVRQAALPQARLPAAERLAGEGRADVGSAQAQRQHGAQRPGAVRGLPQRRSDL